MKKTASKASSAACMSGEPSATAAVSVRWAASWASITARLWVSSSAVNVLRPSMVVLHVSRPAAGRSAGNGGAPATPAARNADCARAGKVTSRLGLCGAGTAASRGC